MIPADGTRYRARLFGRIVGPWRDTRRHALEDAHAAGGASFGTEPWDRDKLFLGPGGEIETRRADRDI